MKICQACGRDTSVNFNDRKLGVYDPRCHLVFSVSSNTLWGASVYCKNCAMKIAYEVLAHELGYKK